MKSLILALSSIFFVMTSYASETTEFSSGNKRVLLVELFTSEGCHSCPPADEWLSELQYDPELWRTFVPVAFHVDYWDYIGWKDPLAKPAHSARQRQHKVEGNISSVYTPGFVVGGKEWKRWFYSRDRFENSPKTGPKLDISVTKHTDSYQINANFERPDTRKYVLHIALLGFDLDNKITRGENKGKHLNHDFVATHRQQIVLKEGKAQFNLSEQARTHSNQAIAAWVSVADTHYPVQATGGWLP